MPIEYAQEDFFRTPVQAAAIFRRRRALSVLPHFHNFAELIFVLSGRGQHVLGNQALPFQAGDVMLVPAGSTHHYRQLCDCHLACLLLRPELLLNPAMMSAYAACFDSARHGLCHAHPEPAVFQQMLTWIDLLEIQPWPGGQQELSHLLHSVAQAATRTKPGRAPAIFDDKTAAQLAAGLRYLETNFTEPAPVTALPDLVHMSPRTLLRRFQEVTGRSPISYVGDLRLHHAMLQLRRRQRSILEVAVHTGFGDLSYFYRSFNAATGLTPRAWRNNPAHVW